MRYSRTVRAAMILALACTAAACGDSKDEAVTSEPAVTTVPSPATSATSPATSATSPDTSAPDGSEAGPVGVIALGHSALTGENTDPRNPGAPAEENSWATGTAAEVNSVYQRLVERRADTEGHVSNQAQGGAAAGALVIQAKRALAQVPAPELAIIQTIDGDIRCDGTDAAHVPEFGEAVDEVLAYITEASPETKIFMVSQWGSPQQELEDMADLIASDPAVRAMMTGPPPCGFLDENGDPQPENIATLTAIIDSYEAEMTRMCALYPTCYTDGGGDVTYRPDVTTARTADYNHASIAGLAGFAAAMWPIVEDVLDD
jgi:hypothetical protein